MGDIMDIYDVKVCKFISKEQHGNVWRLNRSDFITHYCVVDFDNLIARDIFSGEQFRVLRKMEDGKIYDMEKVELNCDYALYLNLLELSQLSKCELFKVKLACLKSDLLTKFFKKGPEFQKQNVIKR